MFKRIIQKIYNYRYKKALSPQQLEERFSNIYKMGIWFSNKESKSGSGSTLYATDKVRKALPDVLTQLKAEKLIDIGCGDFNWMKEVKLPCDYLGIDIVKTVIEENKRRYTNHSIDFAHINAVDTELPKGFDVVLCREVLFHLSFNDGLKLVENILNSDAKYLLITSDNAVTKNSDIKSGEFRNINLKHSPYNFTGFITELPDDAITKDRILAVINVSEMRRNKIQ